MESIKIMSRSNRFELAHIESAEVK